MRALAAGLALFLAAPVAAALTPMQLAGTGATPPAAATLPLLDFVDQDGRRFQLAPDGRPTVLLFADYTCRHICGPGMTLAAGALHDARLRAGRDYRMIVIGLDQDGPAKARAMAAAQLRGLADEAMMMKLLTGPPEIIMTVERRLGYHAVYDPQADQFAHDATVYVFAGDGRLSALVPEMIPALLPKAIEQAAKGISYQPPGTPTASSICYGIATMSGPYAKAIAAALRISGAAIALLLAGVLLRGVRRARKPA